MRLKMGTRGSALARAQSSWAARGLESLHPGLEIETVIITTSGDRFSAAVNEGEDVPAPGEGEAPPPPRLGAARTAREENDSAPNVKAMFVKEIERALLDGEIDFAVHSSKDLPAEIPEGLRIGAYPPREVPWDVFIGRTGIARFEDVPENGILGTASLRRQIQLKTARPDLRFKPIRGNVDTRLKKLHAGEADGIILAAAGLKRLGRSDVSFQLLSSDAVVPAPGQGALALEIRSDRADMSELLVKFDDGDTRLEVELERRFMRDMGGGCDVPLGALARARPDGVEFTVFWSDAAGASPIRFSGRSGRRPEELASLAEGLRGRIRDAG